MPAYTFEFKVFRGRRVRMLSTALFAVAGVFVHVGDLRALATASGNASSVPSDAAVALKYATMRCRKGELYAHHSLFATVFKADAEATSWLQSALSDFALAYPVNSLLSDAAQDPATPQHYAWKEFGSQRVQMLSDDVAGAVYLNWDDVKALAGRAVAAAPTGAGQTLKDKRGAVYVIAPAAQAVVQGDAARAQWLQDAVHQFATEAKATAA